jgi:hypothetical protein
MRTTRQFVVALIAAVILAPGALIVDPRPALAGGCNEQKGWVEHFPQQAAFGARMRWKGRVTHASDWAVGGFASQVLLVGTDANPDDQVWVEIGLTHGFQGLNDWTFYTAHKALGGVFAERRITAKDPASGVNYRWSGRLIGSTYWLTIEKLVAPTYEYSTSWNGHASPTVMYSGGFEATCNETSRVDRTYISQNQFYRVDSQWIDVDNGERVLNPGAGSVEWCQQPRLFRYFLHSNIDETLCS